MTKIEDLKAKTKQTNKQTKRKGFEGPFLPNKFGFYPTANRRLMKDLKQRSKIMTILTVVRKPSCKW